MISVTQQTESKLRQMLLEKDPHAFVLMSEGPEIFGNFEKRL